MIIQQRFDVLLQIHFYIIFTNVILLIVFLLILFMLFYFINVILLILLIVIFSNSLDIYELPKIYNKIPKYSETLALNNNHLPGQFYVKTPSSL